MLCQIRVIYQDDLPMLTWGNTDLTVSQIIDSISDFSAHNTSLMHPWSSHCFSVSEDKDHFILFNKLLGQFPRNFEKLISAHDAFGWSLFSHLTNITNVHLYILNSTLLTHTSSRQLITEFSDGRAHIYTAVH